MERKVASLERDLVDSNKSRDLIASRYQLLLDVSGGIDFVTGLRDELKEALRLAQEREEENLRLMQRISSLVAGQDDGALSVATGPVPSSPLSACELPGEPLVTQAESSAPPLPSASFGPGVQNHRMHDSDSEESDVQTDVWWGDESKIGHDRHGPQAGASSSAPSSPLGDVPAPSPPSPPPAGAPNPPSPPPCKPPATSVACLGSNSKPFGPSTAPSLSVPVPPPPPLSSGA